MHRSCWAGTFRHHPGRPRCGCRRRSSCRIGARLLGTSRAGVLAPFLLLVVGLGARDAAAHAPPLAARVLLGDSDRDAVIVTNRGLVFQSRTTGAGRLLCNEALLLTTSEIPKLAVRAEGGLLVGSSRGLRSTNDDGCTWSDVGGMMTANISALASDPDNARTVYVGRYDGETSGVLVTEDGGSSWSRVLATSEGQYVHSLLAPRAGQLYASVTTYTSQPPVHTLLSTRDGGRQWERHLLPLKEVEYAAVIAASHPADPERLALYTIANSPGLDPGRVLWSSDGGNGVQVVLELPEVRDVTYDPSGRLWVAARDGLYRSSVAGDFQRVSAASELGCVDFAGDALLVCGHYAGVATAASSPGVGISKDAGLTFQSLIEFGRVEASVGCADSSETSELCEQPWSDWRAEMLPAPPGAEPQAPSPTVAVPGAATGASSFPDREATSASAGGGCDLAPAGRRRGAPGMLLLLLAALERWRSRATRAGPRR